MPLNKETKPHPSSKHWHFISFIITCLCDLPDFFNTRAMKRAKCSIDHFMIKSTMKLWGERQNQQSQGWPAGFIKWQVSWNFSRFSRRKVECFQINHVQGIQRETQQCSKEAQRQVWWKQYGVRRVYQQQEPCQE